MMNIPTTELAKIPYIRNTKLSGRFIATLTFYKDNEWEMWAPVGNKLIKVPGWPSEAFYFSKEPEKDDDLYFHFLNFLAQRANFTYIQKPYNGLVDDFFNLSASLAKLEYFHKHREEIGVGVSRIVATELEYIFSVCRSIFDLLQEIIAKQWKNILLLDSSTKKVDMPETFSKTILFKGKPRNSGEFTSRFGVPLQLDDFYCRHIDFFMSLRAFRDNIAHPGSAMDTIFSTERGFAVSADVAPFAQFNIWSEKHKQENNLYSLSPAIGYFIQQTLFACEDFSQTIEKIIKFPPETVPDMNLFMRGYFGKQLIDNNKAIQGSKWWDD